MKYNFSYTKYVCLKYVKSSNQVGNKNRILLMSLLAIDVDTGCCLVVDLVPKDLWLSTYFGILVRNRVDTLIYGCLCVYVDFEKKAGFCGLFA